VNLIQGLVSVDKLEVSSRRVLLRVDLDGEDHSPEGVVSRLRLALPTIKHLLGRGARLVLLSRLFRKGNNKIPSLEAVGLRLAELLTMDIVLADDCVGDGAKKVLQDLRDGRLALLENLEFHGEEEDRGSESFARELSKLADIYVNDSLANTIQTTASIQSLPKQISQRGCGLALYKELQILDRMHPQPPKPFHVVLGGELNKSTLGFLLAALPKIQGLHWGGSSAMAALSCQGANPHWNPSPQEKDLFGTVRELLEKAQQQGLKVTLPIDFTTAPNGSAFKLDEIPLGAHELDIGPETLALFRQQLLQSASIFWLGSMGVTRSGSRSPSSSTVQMAEIVAEAANCSVVMGEEPLKAVEKTDLSARMALLSRGGQATLNLLQGQKLPGVEALRS